MDKLNEREIAIMNEAFTIGRVYSKSGEKKSLIEINKKLEEKCLLMANATAPVLNTKLLSNKTVVFKIAELKKTIDEVFNIIKISPDNNPFCRACKEPDCLLEGAEHGGDNLCALLRKYLALEK